MMRRRHHHNSRRRVAAAAIVLVLLAAAVTLWLLMGVTRSALATIDVGLAEHPESIALDEPAGRALFADGDSAVSLIDTRRGRLVRVIDVGSAARPHSLAVATRAGRAFVISMGSQSLHGFPEGPSQVSMLDIRSGVLLRTLTIGIEATSGAVAERAGHLFVACVGATKADGSPLGPGAVSMLDAHTGALLRTVAVGRRPVAVVVAQRAGRVFVLNQASNSVSILDARTGALLRTVPVGGLPTAAAVDEQRHRAFIANAGAGSVSILDTRRGMLVRTVVTGAAADAVAVDAQTGRVVVTGLSAVRILAARSGAVLHTIAVGGDPVAVAVDSRNGLAFVTGTDGGVFAVVHHVAPGQPPEWAGYVSVINLRNGALLYTVRVGRDPRGVAVDERVGRAFVANYWSNSVSMLDATR